MGSLVRGGVTPIPITTTSQRHSGDGAVNAYNLVAVAEKLKEKNNEARFVFAADRDRPKAGETLGVGERYATKAAQAVSGQVVVPRFLTFGHETRLTDFNDLHTSEGLFAVRGQIEDVVQLSIPSQQDSEQFLTSQQTLNLLPFINDLYEAGLAPFSTQGLGVSVKYNELL